MANDKPPTAFTYPARPQFRRHAPSGYRHYRSYRPWLRDEFAFRCVYCLIREQWGQFTGQFDLDHFDPSSGSSTTDHAYTNLVYGCHTCNLRKGSRTLPDVESHLTRESIRVCMDGRIASLSSEVERIVDILALNSPRLIQWRMSWIRIIDLAARNDPALHERLMGYPENLPDLSTLRPSTNSKPGGIDQSAYAKRERNDLPSVYFE